MPKHASTQFVWLATATAASSDTLFCFGTLWRGVLLSLNQKKMGDITEMTVYGPAFNVYLFHWPCANLRYGAAITQHNMAQQRHSHKQGRRRGNGVLAFWSVDFVTGGVREESKRWQQEGRKNMLDYAPVLRHTYQSDQSVAGSRFMSLFSIGSVCLEPEQSRN